jgi:Calcineurin-like phosphoesterase
MPIASVLRSCIGRPALALLAAAGIGLTPSMASAAAGPVEWSGVDRVVAFADVHGAYADLTALLQSVRVVDSDLRWTGGKTRLVSLGDLLDRGDDSRKVMDLLMRLQQEAAVAGGQVHVVLGNHETMNVLGDLRYVDKGEFASYVADEDPAVRADHKVQFLARQPGSTDADFERLFPPGYFGHRKMLGPEGKYGAWLLTLPAAITINGTVYMHGGPSTALGNRSIAELAADYSAAVAGYVAAESELRKAGLIQLEDAYAKRADLARTRLDAMPADQKAALGPAVARFKAADDSPLLGASGPNWYRGASLCNECAESDVLKPFLQRTAAKRVVVGHTVARNGTVVSRFDGAIVKLDAGMNHAVYKGRPAALVSDASGSSRVAYANPTLQPAAVPAEPLYLSSQTLGEDDVAEILTRGTIAVTETCAPGIIEVRVTLDGRSVDGIFESAPAEIVKRELAAFRLDRLLGLGLVPATVARDHDGRSGVLQGRPENWVSEQDRQNSSKGAPAALVCQTISNGPKEVPARRPPQARPAKMPSGGWCELPPQFQLAYAFDALIDNRGRTFDRYLYDADTAMMFLSGHAATFGSGTDVAKALEPALAKTGPEMQLRLRRLDAASVKAAIGEHVDEREIKALLERRDRVLRLSGAMPGA